MSVRTLGLLVDLAAAACSLAYLVMRARCRRIVVDHRLLFTVGHLYYLALPSVLARLRVLDGQYSFVWGIYHSIPAGRALAFSTWSLCVLLAFHAGAAIGTRRPAPAPLRPRNAMVRAGVPALVLGVILSLLLFAAIVVINLSIIRSGYRSNDPTLIQSQTGRGTLAAGGILVGAMLLYTRSRFRDTTWPFDDRSPRSAVRSLWAAALFVPVAGILLLAGGRLYASTVLVAGAVWTSIAVRPIRRWVLISLGVAAFALLTAYGALRTGSVPTASNLGLYATTESVQGSIALFNTLEDNDDQFALVRAPVFLASDFVNIVPRVLLPDKDDLRVTPEERGFVLDNPLGGLSVGVSLLINFGSVGSVVVVAAVGYGFSRLRARTLDPRASVLRSSYALAAATLLMVFYRDPFSISIVRWWLLNATLIPLFMSAAIRLVSATQRQLTGPVAPVVSRERPVSALQDR